MRNGKPITMNADANDPGGKKPYESPKLMSISLRPEEAVLGNCKTAASGGPVSGTCAALVCRTIGS